MLSQNLKARVINSCRLTFLEFSNKGLNLASPSLPLIFPAVTFFILTKMIRSDKNKLILLLYHYISFVYFCLWSFNPLYEKGDHLHLFCKGRDAVSQLFAKNYGDMCLHCILHTATGCVCIAYCIQLQEGLLQTRNAWDRK